MSLYDSIIFDLDGTLWNATNTCLEAWNRVLKDRGYDQAISKRQLHSVFGMQHDKIGNILLPGLDSKQQQEIMEDIYTHEVAFVKKLGGNLFDNTEKVLKHLYSEYPLFIVSNCQKGYIEAFLDHYRFNHFFEDIECSGNTGLEKACNIRRIIERNNLNNPVYIGDTAGDKQACEKLDIKFIYAGYGFGDRVKADLMISDIDALINTDILKAGKIW